VVDEVIFVRAEIVVETLRAQLNEIPVPAAFAAGAVIKSIAGPTATTMLAMKLATRTLRILIFAFWRKARSCEA
jgi:Ca2+/H+ antiporter